MTIIGSDLEIINIDTEQYNHLHFDRRELLTLDNDNAEAKAEAWFKYMRYPKDTIVYRYVRKNGVKWMVME